MRKFNTTRFGEIEEADEKIVHFAQGLPAFEEEHEFVIIPYDETSPCVPAVAEDAGARVPHDHAVRVLPRL